MNPAILYHGTLKRHLPSIEIDGIVPSVGEFTKRSYGDRAVPAVFMTEEGDLARAVHAMVAQAMDEITEDDYAEFDIDPHCHLNDALFYRYAALLVVEMADTFAKEGSPFLGTSEPPQIEDGDWYSLEPVRPTKIIAGEELGSFLAERSLTPSSINSFVDSRSDLTGARPRTPPSLAY